ncbi:hypothetical protein [Streptomyces mirabilis]|uniref:hypothetical protein n=1 Tax=Streptomyces mirabilis TaxID=68239 RepID=UPI002255739F|nr:hypothetical protein [Streptomyces mirabilis]MCX4609387.1 hypothetical protein [Streptomyces mirabilis]
MPVSPVPCAPGDGGTPGTCACAPSIASTPLCRADGTTVLVVIRSECADCGSPAADPAVIGWIDPATGTYTPGAAPADAGPCESGCSCSPSISTTPMCRADGTTVLVVIRSDCADCDTPAPDPAIVGWIDPLSGVFTPGTAPADAGPCTTDCIDTVCRQRCDDTDGDGAPDATYSELWCVKADGTAELVLTYQDDPSTPYVPTAPVDCTYGCPESETVTLCDDSGAFLRRYTWLQGTATFEDFALDGATPHVVTGTVGVCSGEAGPGGDVTTCCSPSIASTPLCRDDGTTVLLVVRSGCVDCGATPADPAVVGWIDATSGLFTAGQAPADAGPCTAGCVDTVCRLRCDDTDGDGTADATYSELWCIHVDGSATLVLTYQDDPSVPYVPTAPVDCEHGLVSSQAVTLCDDDGPFLRLYQWINGVASFEDVELDGATPHTVTGTVSTCAGQAEPACAAQTTPAATLGLCLADGTPIAVVLTRDCAGVVTQDGWINLVTGTYSTGAPPAGAQACGDSRAFELAGLLCDVDPATEDVLGLVLVEYEYAPDGSLASVRLVDPGTGNTYTLQGELSICPARTGTPAALDLTVLCDVQADGTAVPFLRDYRRDATTSLINGHTDYGLDGTPYTATGTIGVCAEPCSNVATLLLCDLPDDEPSTGVPVVADTAQQFIADIPNGDFVLRPGGGAALWSGGTIAFGPDVSTNPGVITQVHRYVAATLQADAPGCNAGTVHLSLSVVVENFGPGAGCSGAGRFRLFHTDGSVLASGTGLFNTPVGAPQTLTIEADVPAADLAAGDVAVWLDVETFQTATCPPPDQRQWEARSFTAAYAYDIDGCGVQFLRTITTDCVTGAVLAVTDTTLDGAPYTVTGQPAQCASTSGGTVVPGTCTDVETLPLCDTATDGTVTAFLRHLTYGCDGTLTGTTDTAVDGTTPYTAAGTVGICPAPVEECRNTSTLLVCDLPTDGTPTPTVTDTGPAPYYPYTTGISTPGAQTLWDGGTLTLPAAAGPQPGTGGTVRTAAAIIHAPRPVCDSGTAHVVVQVDVSQLGPDDGCRATGFLALYNGTANRVALALAPANTPAGWAGTLTAEADVPAADLAAGNIAVVVAFDAYDDSGAACPPPRHTAWQLSQFDATVVYDQTGCAAQFLRNVTTDCETGAVTAVTDTTLDGQPYTVTGEPGQCTAAGGGSCCPEQPCPAQSVIEACRCDDTDGDGLPDVGYVELLAVDCAGTVTSLGTYTDGLTGPYAPVSPVDCNTLGDEEGAEPAFGAQAHRVELSGAATWTADAWPTLQSVTAVAHGGTGTITTADGPSTLHQGEAATWSIARDEDARLTGPLVIAADTGTVTVTFTTGVQL